MQLAIVLLIVGFSVFYIVRKFRRDLSSKSPCSSGCGCSGCDVGDSSCSSGETLYDKK